MAKPHSLTRKGALLLAFVLAAQPVAAASDYFLVVPMPGRISGGSGEPTIPGPTIMMSLSDAQLPEAVAGQPYVGFNFQSSLQVLGDAAFNASNVAWRVASGELPTGLSLSAGGFLAGTPVVETDGLASFDVAASYKGQEARRAYAITTVAAAEEDPEDLPPEGVATEGSELLEDGAARLLIAPARISFGYAAVGVPTTPVVVSISNTGTAEAPLAIIPPSGTRYSATHACPALLPIGATCQVSLVATPADGTTETQYLKVALPSKETSVRVSSTGRYAVIKTTSSSAAGTTSSINYGVVAVGQFATAETVVTNASRYYPLKLENFRVDGTAKAQFSVEPDCPAVLAPRASCTVRSQYAPQQAGAHSAALKMDTNSNGFVSSVSLSGTAAGDLAVSALSFAGATLSGGGTLIVTGSGFLPGASVSFGGISAATTFDSTTSLKAVVPPAAAPGMTWVSVANPDGGVATAPMSFERAYAFTTFTPTTAYAFSNQSPGVPSSYVTLYLQNTGKSSADTAVVSALTVTGPFEQSNTSSLDCSAGKVLTVSGSCRLRLRFTPPAEGNYQGAVLLTVNGEEKVLPLTGTGASWEGVLSGSNASVVPFSTDYAISYNQMVGAAPATKTATWFLHNQNLTESLSVSFALEKGQLVSLGTPTRTTSNTGSQGAGCNSNGLSTTVCNIPSAANALSKLAIPLTITATLPPGAYSDTLIVKDAAGQERFRVPIEIQVTYDAQAVISMEPYETVPRTTAVEFPATNLTSTATAEIYVRNAGAQGALRLEKVELLTETAAFFLTSSSVRLYGTSLSSLAGCGSFVTGAHAACVADDMDGGARPHVRIVVNYKPLVQGDYSAVLRVTHTAANGSSQTTDLPITGSTKASDLVFSSKVASQPITEVPELILAGNAHLGVVDSNTQYVYLNRTSGDGVTAGYFVLEGGSASFKLSASTLVTSSGGSGANCGAGGTDTQSGLCVTTSAYPNLRTTITASSALGLGTHARTLKFVDSNGNSIAETPITVQVLNDSRVVLSSAPGSTVALPGNSLNFGRATAPTIEGQSSSVRTQTVFVRNTGTIGRLKIDRAVIEGEGFSFIASTGIQAVNNSGALAVCSGAQIAANEIQNCLLLDALTPTARIHAAFNVQYAPLAAGVTNGTLTIWHSGEGPNPITVSLHGEGVSELVAGELSSNHASVVSPTGVFTTMTGTTTNKVMDVYVHNTQSMGALNGDSLQIEGDANFTFQTVRIARTTNSQVSCRNTGGGVLTTDNRASTSCLADNKDGADTYHNLVLRLRCTATESGTYTGTLRIRTQGQLHTLPLTCTKA